MARVPVVAGWPWFVEAGDLYFGTVTKVSKADIATFQPLGDWWGRDCKHVFCAGRAIRDADVSSFRVLNRLYAKDAHRAYTIKGPIEAADAKTFQAMGPTIHPFNTHNGFAKDSRNVYHSVVGGVASLVKGADPESFRACGNGYGCDNRTVYFERKALPNADPTNWIHIAGVHSRSGDYAFFRDSQIPGASGSRLQSLPLLSYGEEWSRDDKQYFCREEPRDPRSYLEIMRQCFIFVGKAVDVNLSSNGQPLDPDEAHSWEYADHGWIHVVCEKWLQEPPTKVEEKPKIGEPFKFGECDLSYLASQTWMKENRIWIFNTFRDRSRKGKKLCLSRAPVWWQYSALHELGKIEGLIKDASV